MRNNSIPSAEFYESEPLRPSNWVKRIGAGVAVLALGTASPSNGDALAKKHSTKRIVRPLSKTAVGTTKATIKPAPTSSIAPPTTIELTLEEKKKAALKRLSNNEIVPGTLDETGNNGGFVHIINASVECVTENGKRALKVGFLMSFDQTKNDPGLISPDGSVNYLVGAGNVNRPGSASDVNATVGGLLDFENNDPSSQQISFSIATPKGDNVYYGKLPIKQCSSPS